MAMSALTRRATLAALGAATLAVAGSCGALARRSTLPPPGIQVDVAPSNLRVDKSDAAPFKILRNFTHQLPGSRKRSLAQMRSENSSCRRRALFLSVSSKGTAGRLLASRLSSPTSIEDAPV